MDNARIIDHARNPHNWGDMEDANGVFIGNRECGDIVMFFIKVVRERLEKVNFLVQGCQALAACCSITTVLAKGRTIWEAMQIKSRDIEQALGGLPPEEQHTADYAAAALYGAIQNYLKSGVSTVRNMRGSGWRSLYLQAQREGGPSNLYEMKGGGNNENSGYHQR